MMIEEDFCLHKLSSPGYPADGHPGVGAPHFVRDETGDVGLRSGGSTRYCR